MPISCQNSNLFMEIDIVKPLCSMIHPQLSVTPPNINVGKTLTVINVGKTLTLTAHYKPNMPGLETVTLLQIPESCLFNSDQVSQVYS